MKKTTKQNILDFLHLLHHMKRIERFQGMPFWKNSGIKRWDSNAEHTYRVSVMAILLVPYLKKEYNIDKLLKMILIHDIVEIIIDDKFPFKSEDGKYSLPEDYIPDDPSHEIRAFKKIIQDLPDSLKSEFEKYFTEFVTAEIRKPTSNEAQLAVALDRLEASLQVSDYIRLNEFEITLEHSSLQKQFSKSKSSIGEPELSELVELINDELTSESN